MYRPGKYVLLLSILLAIFSACADETKNANQPLLIATIDEQAVRLNDFKREIRWLSLRDENSNIEHRDKGVLKLFLNRYIDKRLLLREVEYNHVVIASNEIDAAYQRSIDRWTDSEFLEELKKKDMTATEYKQNLREHLLIQKYFQTLIFPRIVVRDNEISQYLEKNAELLHKPESVHVRQIVTKTEKEALHALESINKGLAFEDAALKYSLSPDAKNGGDLGYVERGTMPRFFEEAVFALETNKLSAVVPSDYGFFIFEVLEKTDALPLPENVARLNAESILRRQKEQSTQEQLIADLRKQSEINVMEYNLALLF